MTIDGIIYIVVKSIEFSHNGQARQEITLRRLKGKRLYTVVLYENGSLSSIV